MAIGEHSQKLRKKADSEKNAAELAAELGRKLCELRTAQGLTLDDARATTKIQKKHLAAIENGELEKLPKGPFCRSFLKQYCEYLNASDLWERYDRITNTENSALNAYVRRDSEASYIDTPKVFKQRSYLLIYLIVILSLAAAAWVTWQYRGEILTDAVNPISGGTAATLKNDDAAVSPDAAETPQNGDAAGSAAVSVDLGWMDGKPPAEAQLPADQAKSETAAPVQTTPVVKVTSRGVIWIKFSIGNEVFFQGLLNDGESREYSPRTDAPLRVRYGNPSKSAVSWGGTETMAGSDANPITRYYWYDGRVTDKI